MRLPFHLPLTMVGTMSWFSPAPTPHFPGSNHGGRAALHSSNVELMDQRDPSCERPVHGVGRGRERRINVENPKI
jgi:hypothetical protein